MFTPKKEEYIDQVTGEKKQRQVKYYPDAYKNRIGRSYNDYAQYRQMNLFEDFNEYEDEKATKDIQSESGQLQYGYQQAKEESGKNSQMNDIVEALSHTEVNAEKKYSGRVINHEETEKELASDVIHSGAKKYNQYRDRCY